MEIPARLMDAAVYNQRLSPKNGGQLDRYPETRPSTQKGGGAVAAARQTLF
jgi:hypothetical protein